MAAKVVKMAISLKIQISIEKSKKAMFCFTSNQKTIDRKTRLDSIKLELLKYGSEKKNLEIEKLRKNN